MSSLDFSFTDYKRRDQEWISLGVDVVPVEMDSSPIGLRKLNNVYYNVRSYNITPIYYYFTEP